MAGQEVEPNAAKRNAPTGRVRPTSRSSRTASVSAMRSIRCPHPAPRPLRGRSLQAHIVDRGAGPHRVSARRDHRAEHYQAGSGAASQGRGRRRIGLAGQSAHHDSGGNGSEGPGTVEAPGEYQSLALPGLAPPENETASNSTTARKSSHPPGTSGFFAQPDDRRRPPADQCQGRSPQRRTIAPPPVAVSLTAVWGSASASPELRHCPEANQTGFLCKARAMASLAPAGASDGARSAPGRDRECAASRPGSRPLEGGLPSSIS